MLQTIWVTGVLAIYGVMGAITVQKFKQDKVPERKKKDYKPPTAVKPSLTVPDTTLLKLIWAFGVFGAAYGLSQYKQRARKTDLKIPLLAAIFVHCLVIYHLVLQRQVLFDYWTTGIDYSKQFFTVI